MQTVFIVRDTEERFIKGVYAHQLDAQDWLTEQVREMTDEPEGSEDWEDMMSQYEILEMSVE